MGFGAAKSGTQGKGQGTIQPTGYNGPIRPSMNQPAQVPPQGGKFPGYSLPPQGGKSQADQDRFNAQIIASQNQPAQGGGLGMGGVAGKGNAPVQPTVPAQGGKAPGTLANTPTLTTGRPFDFSTVINNIGQPTAPAGLPLGYNGPIPGVLNPGDYISPGMNQPTQPAPVMPRPVPQVMPRQPTPRPTMTRPSLIGSGLTGLRGRR